MDRICTHCATHFTAHTSTMRYCSATCRNQGKYAAKKADGRYARDLERRRALYEPRPPRPPNPARICTIDGCERTHWAHELCKMHSRRGHYKPKPWTDRQRNGYHRRRARLNGARNSDAVLLSDLIARYQRCGWCGDAIDTELRWPDPMSRSIDHVIPVSKGGEHTLLNTRLLHLRCNSQRGNRTETTRPKG